MTRKSTAVACWMLSLVIVPGLAGQAQTRSAVGAMTRLLDPTSGTTSPALWLGFDYEIERPDFGVRLFSAASPAWRGGWGGEGSFTGWARQPVGPAIALVGSVSGAVDQPAAYAGAGELGARGGVERRWGPLSLRAGLTTFGRFEPAWSQLAGAFAASTWTVGQGLELSGEIGRAASLSGSAASLLPGDGRNDTLALGDKGGGAAAARTLGHWSLAARMRRSGIELSGRLLRRSGLTNSTGLGWEAGLAVEALPGARLRIAAGRAPTAQSIYLPYRRQLSFGLEFVRSRDRFESPADLLDGSIVHSGFEIQPQSGDLITFVIRNAVANRVELAGDFTGWEAIALERQSLGTWRTTVTLPPGIHQVNVRFDGGPWRVPEGLASTEDGFGGRAGVLVIQAADSRRPDQP